MTTQSIEYGTRTAVTCTLASLANGSNRQSAAVSNATALAVDYEVAIQVTTGTSPTANDTIIVYCYAGDGTTYAGGCTGSDAAYSAGQELQLVLCALIVVSATSNTSYQVVIPSIAALFGGTLPKAFGFVVENASGAALNSTAGNHFIEQTAINYTYA
jgi:hypothetical protein